MHRVFLDANVLFSAAYAPGNRFLQLWELEGTQLVTSSHALEEARRNLAEAQRQERLQGLVEAVDVLEVLGVSPAYRLPAEIRLPEKDRPILAAAVQARASHLLTGDVEHFGPYFGRTVAGVLIQRPGIYLDEREA